MSAVQVTVWAKTMEGLPAADPAMTFQVDEVQPFQRPLVRQPPISFDKKASFRIPVPDGTNPQWCVRPTFSRFAPPDGTFFFPLAQQSFEYAFALYREPSQWKARFTPLNSLSSPRFDAFKSVVSKSHSVDLKLGPTVGDLAVEYDNIDQAAQRLGKMALLNLHSVLVDEMDPITGQNWFSYVQKIVRLDEERFLAEVDKKLFDDVFTILASLSGEFAAQGYSTDPESDLSLHTPNIPPQYNQAMNRARMGTLKKQFEQGDFQLTVSELRQPAGMVYLLDCDMDENLNIAAHAVDMADHLITKGTHPVLMHDYIVRKSAQMAADGISTVDLGYELV